MSATNKLNAKSLIGTSTRIDYTECNCRTRSCGRVFYQSDLKMHLRVVDSSAFFRDKKYDFQVGKWTDK